MKLYRSTFLVKNFTDDYIHVTLGENETNSVIPSHSYEVLFNNVDDTKGRTTAEATNEVYVKAFVSGIVEVARLITNNLINLCGTLEDTLDVLKSPIFGFYPKFEEIHTKVKPIDIAQYRAFKPYTYPEKENEVFTGWYLDKEYEEQVDNELVTQGKFYPMYADYRTMVPICKTKVMGTLYQYMIISSLPCHNVLEKGFYINGTKRKVTQMTTLINAFGETIHRADFSENSIYLYSISLMNTEPIIIKAIPYIVTLDGTEVKGTEVTF